MTRGAHGVQEESRGAEGSVKHVPCGERPLCRPWWACRRGRAGLGQWWGEVRDNRRAAAARGAGSMLLGESESEVGGLAGLWTQGAA